MDLKTLRVLVVDDMSSMRMMIKAVLREMGILLVQEAGDGDRALELLDAQPFGLVVCDWDMPNIDGLAVLQQVRAEPRTRTLPFIMLTANAARDHVSRAIEAGVSDYLAKPFKPIDLMEKIKRVMG
jgi:two-component system chemotaxis response regulator CheY